ncbi:MAG: shikimate dehydrogenase [Dehalogenimonas sp.]
MITATTSLVALIGDPVAHSVSPVMHNAAFRERKLNYTYQAFRVTKEDLAAAVSGLRGLNVRGANITLPHKKAVIPFLDTVDSPALRIGAVNTIVNENGRLTGYNTDAAGFLGALRASGFEPQGKKAVVLGAGGAARAVVFALKDAGVKVNVINRTFSTATALAADTGTEAFEMTDEGYRQALEGALLVVNATSVGLSPDEASSPLPSIWLRPSMTVFDTIYRPRHTRLIREAKAAGCAVIGGLEMLLAQGALSFELWTGEPAPREVMSRTAEAALE